MYLCKRACVRNTAMMTLAPPVPISNFKFSADWNPARRVSVCFEGYQVHISDHWEREREPSAMIALAAALLLLSANGECHG